MGFFWLPENSEMEKMKKNSHLKTTFIRVQISIVDENIRINKRDLSFLYLLIIKNK